MSKEKILANQHKIGLAANCLHISAVLYLIGGAIAVPLFLSEYQTDQGLTFLTISLLALVGGIELVAFGLYRRMRWAWTAGIYILGIYVPSLFLPLGTLGLWALLDSESQAEFKIGQRRR